MANLIAFLNARLDEEEAAAEAAGGEAWRSEPFIGIDRSVESVYATGNNCIARCGITDRTGGESQAAHIARYDPARALREVETKRAVLGMHHPTRPHPEFGFTYPEAAKFCGWCGPGDNWQARQEPDMFSFALWPCGHARLLGAVYSDHPDYRPEWAPGASAT